LVPGDLVAAAIAIFVMAGGSQMGRFLGMVRLDPIGRIIRLRHNRVQKPSMGSAAKWQDRRLQDQRKTNVARRWKALLRQCNDTALADTGQLGVMASAWHRLPTMIGF
jgi:hypothetical protein